jgi:hypothetical protein
VSGGGISNYGTLTIKGSTISGNYAEEDGGGISNDGTLTIKGSTISDNHASYDGGGIYLGSETNVTIGGVGFENTICGNTVGIDDTATVANQIYPDPGPYPYNNIASSCTTKAIGDYYGGGIVAYIFQSGDPGYDASVQHGLIAATADQSTSIVWHNTNDGETGATATALGTGNANTNTIVAFYGTESNAAKLCADYSVTVGVVTYDDWYLPSWNELNKLYAMKVLGFGGFTNINYWSSSEGSSSSALAQDFTGGALWIQGKNSLNNRVRPIRSF